MRDCQNQMRPQPAARTQSTRSSLLKFLCWSLTMALALAPLSLANISLAGTPLAVTKTGKEVSWGVGATVTYHIDQGALGSLNNAQAVTMVQELFGQWQNVSSASVTIQSGGALPVDVTAGNYTTYRTNNNSDSYHPIIFDTDGSITDSVFGAGASDFTAGFAGPGWMVGGVSDGVIVDASAVLNAKFLTSGYGSVTEFKSIILHELGHFLGLGHSQVNIGNAFDREIIFNNNGTLPIMFPISLGDRPVVLTQDDKSQLTRLYPGASAGSLGTIKGKILLSDGVTPFQGANVVARRVDDPTNIAVSSVSGFLYQGTGTNANRGVNDPDKQGYYEISGLPPGNYTVEIEPVHPGFISGSAVGPLDPPIGLPSPSEYYSGSSESNNDAANSAGIVSVGGGQAVDNINIILNNTTLPSAGESESNNTYATANNITLPVTMSGSASSGDAGSSGATGEVIKDFYSFSGNAGEWVTLDMNWGVSSAALTMYLYNYTQGGSPQRIAISMPCLYGSGCVSRAQIGPMKLPSTGTYVIGIGANSGASSYTLQATKQYNGNGTSATVNGANFLPGAAIAPDTIASMFGVNMASATQIATPGQPLPTEMGGARVEVDGIAAKLFYVSPAQINYLIPAAVTAGTKSVVVKNANGEVARSTIEVALTSPAFFTANQNGSGVPAGYITRVAAGSLQQSNEVIANYNGSSFVPVTVDRRNDAIYLILFGTGLRYAPNTNLANDIPSAGGGSIVNVAESVEITIGGKLAQVDYAGQQGAFFGLDQINVLIPHDAVASPTAPVIIKVRDANGNLLTANQMSIALQ